MMGPNVNVFGVAFFALGAAAVSWAITGSVYGAAAIGGFWLAVLSLILLIDIRTGE